jgi:ATP-dependent Clp protease adaptor protein ClpS
MLKLILFPEVEIEEETIQVLGIDDEKTLLLINDEYNSFDHVIECLIKYCKHSLEQAEQCAILTHYKGKCEIKRGTINQLQDIYFALLESGLSVKMT